jgi:hypothetical protein
MPSCIGKVVLAMGLWAGLIDKLRFRMPIWLGQA